MAVLLVGLVVYGVKSDNTPSKYDGFATALKTDGAVFYGAFWCPHCQAMKALFGSAVKKLPYVECSAPDGSSQTQVCIDNKIEGYPTWYFKDGIKLTSDTAPTVCPIKAAGVTLTGVCTNVASTFYKVWAFPQYSFTIKSPTDPVKTGNVWQFPVGAETVGEVPLDFLAQQINYTLPQ